MGKGGTMEPFYFGESSRLLFGVYHPPKGDTSRSVGVVLCHPMGQEYIRSHRALLRLAVSLSSAGFHVLRFDQYGCGDSQGECVDGRIGQWVSDISTAVDELAGGCGADRICTVGLRLGGSLSIMAGIERGDIDGVVLWDPIVNGQRYLNELDDLHGEWLRGSFAKARKDDAGGEQCEILGYPLPDGLAEEIKNLDLLSLQEIPGRNVLLIDSGESVEDESFKKHLECIGVNLHYRHITAPSVWIKDADGMSKGIVPVEVIRSVTSWISEVLA